MTPASNTLLPLMIISLGLLGVILSFLVPDRRKSMISLIMAGVIIVTGLFNLGAQSITRWRLNRRLQSIQRERQADLEEIRKRLQEQAAKTAPAGGAAAPAGRPQTPNRPAPAAPAKK